MKYEKNYLIFLKYRVGFKFDNDLVAIGKSQMHLQYSYSYSMPCQTVSQTVRLIYILLLLLLHYQQHVVQAVVQHPHHNSSPWSESNWMTNRQTFNTVSMPTLYMYVSLCYSSLKFYLFPFSLIHSADLLNISHIVDGQWFLLDYSNILNVGLVCCWAVILFFMRL